MAETKRALILAALLALVREITVANGYTTDAGDAVFLGEVPQLGESDPPVAIALVVEDDDPNDQGHIFIGLPISVQAIAKADLDAPWLAVEAVLGDVKLAVEQADRTLGGLLKGRMARSTTRSLPREPGSTTVGAAVTYRCDYVEVWGNP